MGGGLLLSLASIPNTSSFGIARQAAVEHREKRMMRQFNAEIIIPDLMKTGRTNDCHGAA